uniref:HVA22-like protein n=1 Tax=Arundo donax TaxID=35708 RepID=A0A0A9CP37_ARUDO
MEMAAQHVLYWIPLWYEVKLLFVAWRLLSLWEPKCMLITVLP